MFVVNCCVGPQVVIAVTAATCAMFNPLTGNLGFTRD